MMTRRHAMQGLLGSLAASGPLHAQPFESLDSIGRAKGLRVGSAIGMPTRDGTQKFGFNDERYRALVARECGVFVHENEMKWQALRPNAKSFSFERADRMLAWAKDNRLLVRGHTLLWQDSKFFPDWLNATRFANAAAAEKLLGEHVATVCRHYGSDVFSHDVVNEAVDPANGQLRSNVFTQAMGALESVEHAFRVAREHAPHAQLVYNDFMSWTPSSAKHRAGVLELLRQLKARGAPVDALGLQAHVGTGQDGRAMDPERAQEREWRSFLDEAGAMGLELVITEFDVNDRYLSGDIAQRDEEVAAVARGFLDLTLSYPRLRTLVFWGMADHLSWLQNRWPRADGQAKRPCPYDTALQPKRLRQAVADALRAMPPRAAA